MLTHGALANAQTETSSTIKSKTDTVGSSKDQIPKGVYMWTVDKTFGDVQRQPMDTITHLFQNSVFTAGKQSEYNTLGTIGTPRINRIFTDRRDDDGTFYFSQPYDFFEKQPDEFLFTNTLSPYAHLTYAFCGNRTNGEDLFRAKYCQNAGKKFGVGFSVNYMYGRAYYDEASTSLLNLNLFSSYIGDRYQAHFLLTNNQIKETENGGITNDYYITHPESFDDNYTSSEIPTMLSNNWNRNRDTHLFFTHRYNLGFHRRVRMTDEEIAAKKFAMESQKKNSEKNMGGPNGGPNNRPDNMPGGRPDNQAPAGGRPDNAPVAERPDSPADNRPDNRPEGDAPNGETPAQALGEITNDGRLTLDVATADSLATQAKLEQQTLSSDDEWTKLEFVPVTSFIHTLQIDNHSRINQAYSTPTDYYANTYYDDSVIAGDSIFDQTRFRRIRNTLAISLLEGFNKWAFAGLKAFATSDIKRYELPNNYKQFESYTDNALSIGGVMSRQQGTAFHYNLRAETWLLGDELGQVKLDGDINLNFKLFGDTVTLAANAFFHNEKPNYYLRHYHSQHYWWDDDLSFTTQTHLEGTLAYQKTRTQLRVAVDELTNYTYLVGTYTTDESLGRLNNALSVKQYGDPITVFTAQLQQHLNAGPLNWELIATYQKSTRQDVLPLPDLNIYTNLYFGFKIAQVMMTEIGADARYFTAYTAPDYNVGLGQFVVQGNDEKTTIGNYPIVNVYANFNLKGTRFFVMYTHVNCGMGNSSYFLTPHYPTNQRLLRIGVSWNFFN